MPPPIVFWFDFASPYGYFASVGIHRLAEKHGRAVLWRPVLLWAVLKAHGIKPPAESKARWSYLLHDMTRTAAFMGLPFKLPELPISAHLAMRLFYGITAQRPDLARPFVQRIYEAFMVEGSPIHDPDALASLVAPLGISAEEAVAAMNGEVGRSLLAAAVDEAVADGVVGSPFFFIDGEPFFGVDHVPQMEWFLARQSHV